MKTVGVPAKSFLLPLLVAAVLAGVAFSAPLTIKGYVLDSACAFTKSLDKPISRECAISCANAGSQLVILAEDGTVYWPIAGTTPSSGQNPKLLPFAGQKVNVTGTLYKRGGSTAIVIDKIQPQAAAQM
jgi:hypothetical protein